MTARAPFAAAAAARLSATVDLPSPGSGDVTTTTCAPSPFQHRAVSALRDRATSANNDRGSEMTRMVSGDISRWAMRGIMARGGKPQYRLICCPERGLLSTISMAKAIAKDKRNETKSEVRRKHV